jgi:hypothetical protein
MWTAQIDLLDEGRTRKVSVLSDERPVSYAEVLKLWQKDEPFRTFFIDQLAAAPLSAYRFETPPITTATSGRDFEFVLLDSPPLAAAKANPTPFANQIKSAAANEEVLAFTNLGKDATLVIPLPRGPQGAYCHLAAFVREAPESQKHALWQLVGRTLEEKIGAQPTWLSTAGLGVFWLHVRLDNRPKYYGFAPYKAVP